MAYERRGTAIETHVYNPRALITSMFSGGRHNTVRTSDGKLWAALQSSTVNLYLYMSDDEGFSWEQIDDYWTSTAHYPRSQTNLWDNGPLDAVMVCEKYDWVFLFHIRHIGAMGAGNWCLYYGYCAIDGTGSADYNTGVNWADTRQSGGFIMCHNKHTMYYLYTYYDNVSNWDLKMRRISPRTVAVSGSVGETTKNWSDVYAMCCNDDGEVFVLGCHGGAAIPNTVEFVQYTESSLSFGTPVTIDTAPDNASDFCDFSIAIDGYGTLCAVWGEMDSWTASTTVAWRYATSVDKGLNWTKVDVSNETGWTPFRDDIATGTASPAKQFVTRTDIIGGYDGGFLITYTQDNASSVPKSLVRRLTTPDGTTYTLQDQEEIANVPTADVIAGAKFFKVAEGQLMNIAEPGLVRAAWQVDEGNSGIQDSSIPITIDQDILSIGPYPIEYPSEEAGWTVETAGADELLVTFAIIEGTSNNIDFYDEGYTGDYTTKYYDAFVTHGTSIRVLCYEPTQNAQTGDRSSYDEPTEIWVNMFIDPLSYKTPNRVENADNTTDYVEQDIRRVYLPPDLHISRSYILNKGNYLKRTVWLMIFDGNEYELTQVVPRLMDNQITHYECNAYVSGPSFDPFSRTTLHSET